MKRPLVHFSDFIIMSRASQIIREFGWLLMLQASVALLLSGSGCLPSPNSSVEQNTDGSRKQPQTAEEAAALAKEVQCGDLVSSLQGQFINPQVVLNFDPGQSLSLLNQWSRTCMPRLQLPSTEEISRCEKYVESSVVKTLQDDLYHPSDVEHLQTCVWMSIVRQHVTEGKTSDQGRINALFNYVIRNMSLISEHAEETPFTLNGLLFSGRGTVSDRAWLFAELLKQLKLDVIFISSPESSDSKISPAPRLIGVFAEGNCWLFDPELGIGVPANAETIVPGNDYPIATLADVRANPKLLDRLGTKEGTYPLDEKTFPEADYYFYGHSGWWGVRQAELSDIFSGQNQAEVFDGLTDLRERRGILTRMEEFSKELPEGKSPKFWNYAQLQISGREKMNSLQQQVIRRTMEIYPYPYVQEIEEKDSMGTFDDPTNAKGGQKRSRAASPPKPSGNYYRARSMQVLGDYAEGVRVHMHNQRHSRMILDIDDPRALSNADFQHIREMHGKVMNDATYWLGICKLQQHVPNSQRIAQDKFLQYLREYPDGVWSSSSRYQLALLAAQDQEWEKAKEYLSAIATDDTQSAAAKWLIGEIPVPPNTQAPGPEKPVNEEKPGDPKPEGQKPEDPKSEDQKPSEEPESATNSPDAGKKEIEESTDQEKKKAEETEPGSKPESSPPATEAAPQESDTESKPSDSTP